MWEQELTYKLTRISSTAMVIPSPFLQHQRLYDLLDMTNADEIRKNGLVKAHFLNTVNASITSIKLLKWSVFWISTHILKSWASGTFFHNLLKTDICQHLVLKAAIGYNSVDCWSMMVVILMVNQPNGESSCVFQM